MPSPHNRDGLDHYVYLLEAEGVPFYVGKGRAARAADRISFARKERRAILCGRKSEKLELHQEVLLALQDKGFLVSYRYVVEHLSALTAENLEETMRTSLSAHGFTLANVIGGPPTGNASAISSAVEKLVLERRKYRADPKA